MYVVSWLVLALVLVSGSRPHGSSDTEDTLGSATCSGIAVGHGHAELPGLRNMGRLSESSDSFSFKELWTQAGLPQLNTVEILYANESGFSVDAFFDAEGKTLPRVIRVGGCLDVSSVTISLRA
jgi:hypothetical protein